MASSLRGPSGSAPAWSAPIAGLPDCRRDLLSIGTTPQTARWAGRNENDKPILTLKTLGDVRKMLLGLPEPFQLKTTWGHVGVMLEEAARGGDIIDVVVPLRMVLGMEGVACRPK